MEDLKPGLSNNSHLPSLSLKSQIHKRPVDLKDMDDVMRDPELSSEITNFSLKLLTHKLQEARRALREEEQVSVRYLLQKLRSMS